MLHLKESIIYSNVCIAVVSPVVFFEQIFNYMLGQTPFFFNTSCRTKIFHGYILQKLLQLLHRWHCKVLDIRISSLFQNGLIRKSTLHRYCLAIWARTHCNATIVQCVAIRMFIVFPECRTCGQHLHGLCIKL